MCNFSGWKVALKMYLALNPSTKDKTMNLFVSIQQVPSGAILFSETKSETDAISRTPDGQN